MSDHLTTAAEIVRSHAESLKADGDKAPYVWILLRIGDCTHPRCYAEVFGPELVVVSADTHTVQAIYPREAWRECSVCDADGRVLYVIDKVAGTFSMEPSA